VYGSSSVNKPFLEVLLFYPLGLPRATRHTQTSRHTKVCLVTYIHSLFSQLCVFERLIIPFYLFPISRSLSLPPSIPPSLSLSPSLPPSRSLARSLADSLFLSRSRDAWSKLEPTIAKNRNRSVPQLPCYYSCLAFYFPYP
jgi:hypothetical protein